MRLLRTWIVLVALVAVPAISVSADLSSVALAKEEQPQPPKEFVPVDDIPQGEQIPAINLVAAAYGFVWIVVMGYVFSLARRQKQIESELTALESRKK